MQLYIFARNAQGRVTAVAPAKYGEIATIDVPVDGEQSVIHGPFLLEQLPADARAMVEGGN